jgi:hypothetical protein
MSPALHDARPRSPTYTRYFSGDLVASLIDAVELDQEKLRKTSNLVCGRHGTSTFLTHIPIVFMVKMPLDYIAQSRILREFIVLLSG